MVHQSKEWLNGFHFNPYSKVTSHLSMVSQAYDSSLGRWRQRIRNPSVPLVIHEVQGQPRETLPRNNKGGGLLGRGLASKVPTLQP